MSQLSVIDTKFPRINLIETEKYILALRESCPPCIQKLNSQSDAFDREYNDKIRSERDGYLALLDSLLKQLDYSKQTSFEYISALQEDLFNGSLYRRALLNKPIPSLKEIRIEIAVKLRNELFCLKYKISEEEYRIAREDSGIAFFPQTKLDFIKHVKKLIFT